MKFHFFHRSNKLLRRVILIFITLSLANPVISQLPITQIEGFVDLRKTSLDESIYIGFESGLNTSGVGKDNTFVGAYTGQDNIDGESNCFLGYMSGENNTFGSSNVFIGVLSGSSNLDGAANVFIGTAAGNNSTGSRNVFVGNASGSNISSGNGNICLGEFSGPEVLGTFSDRLYVDNSRTNTPLIYGEFDNDYLIINGRQWTTASPLSTNGNNLSNYAQVIINNTTGGGDVLALKAADDDPDGGTNYVAFFDGPGGLIGEIEGNAGGGVRYESTAGDFAEYLERKDHDQELVPGDVIGVKHGKISFDTKDADEIMVVSQNPVVVGNSPGEDKSQWEEVGFIGQVMVNVLGPVSSGDFIITSGNEDGTAISRSPNEITFEEIPRIIGRAWETNKSNDPKLINTVVGLDHSSAYQNVIGDQQKEINELKMELKEIKELLLLK